MNLSRLLLDTHVFLWWRTNDSRLAPEALDAIAYAGQAYVSAATVWEIAIKRALGRLDLDGSIVDGIAESGFVPLPMEGRHAETAGSLPLLHEDPFDRMLIAQAKLERLVLVSHDCRLDAYDAEVLLI